MIIRKDANKLYFFCVWVGRPMTEASFFIHFDHHYTRLGSTTGKKADIHDSEKESSPFYLFIRNMIRDESGHCL